MGMAIKFWGVRGSVASPGPHTVGFGGNTSCVEVQAGKTRLVLDAGTGIRALGESMMREGGADFTLLLSHLHSDHIMGLPFFGPIYHKGSRMRVISGHFDTPLQDALRRQMSAPLFPVDFSRVPCHVEFDQVQVFEPMVIGEARVTCCPANHPDTAYSWRIDHGDESMVYATDTEHAPELDQNLLRLARQADVLIYDAQYLPEEYDGRTGLCRKGWGHSTFEAAARLAIAAQVKQLVLFHHDPCRDDFGVASLEARARCLFPQVSAAREGQMLALS